MEAFFSGTDLATLRSEGVDRNCFVSLIVNNRGTYSAAVTRKVLLSRKVKEQCAYSLFGEDNPVTQEREYEEKDLVRIEYAMLDVKRQPVDNPLSYIDARFDEIILAKEMRTRPKNMVKTVRNIPFSDYEASNQRIAEKYANAEEVSDFPAAPKELSLFPEQEEYSLDKLEEDDAQGVCAVDIDPTVIHEYVEKMLLCSLFANTGKLNVKHWVKHHMGVLYDKYFGDSESLTFYNYAGWFLEYIFSMFQLPPEDSPQYEEWMDGIALALREELAPYEHLNPYIDKLIEFTYSYF